MNINKPRRRIEGLDSIRFVCAVIVVFDHVKFADLSMLGKPATHDGRVVHALIDGLFNGPAAVIAFFLISGFCIHYPYRGSRPLPLAAYFSRRMLRICLPSAAFILYLRLVLKDTSTLQDTVLWSILCEIIYYALYPGLRILRQHIGWAWVIAATFLVTFALGLSHLPLLVSAHNGYPAFGAGLTWLIGLPCWLMGCWIAENFEAFPSLTPARMWGLRGLVFLITAGLRLVKFHSTSPFASNVLTLSVFSFLACFWIGCEIVYSEHHPPNRRLEWAGTWSYSLYLAHSLVFATIVMAGVNLAKTRLENLLVLVAVFVFSFGYYAVIELPSHHLAINVSRRLGPSRTPVDAVSS